MINEDTINAADLKKRALGSLGWKFGTLLVSFIFQFGIGVVLARLLPPEDFGLIGLALIVTGFAELFSNLGLGAALIQRKIVTEKQIRVVFTISVLTSILMAILLFFTAPLFVNLLKDMRVISILRVLSINFIFGGVRTVSYAMLLRSLSFRTLFFVSTISTLLYAPIVIGMALAGFGVWSLVYASLLQQGITSLLAYFLVRHPVRPLLAFREAKQLISFGAGISLASIFNYFALQGDYFVVGRMFGPGPLGIYTRAYSLMTLPTSYFIRTLGDILFPAASRLQHEPDYLRRAYLYTLSTMGLISIPIAIAMFILAPEIIRGIYGEKWAQAILPLQILSVFGAFRSLYNGQANFIRAKGWVYRIVVYQAVYAIMVAFGAWYGATIAGLPGVATAVGLAILIMWALVSYTANQATLTDSISFWRTFRPGLMMGLVVTFSCITVKWSMSMLGYGRLWILLGCLVISIIACTVAFITLPHSLFLNLPVRILRTFQDVLPRRCHPVIVLLGKWIIHAQNN